MAEDDRTAVLIALFSGHLPEVHDHDGDPYVACSCGNALYVGHLPRLILDRLDRAPGMAIARVAITRHLTEDDLVDHVQAVDGDGDDLALTEALGMLRLAEDTLIRERMGDDA